MGIRTTNLERQFSIDELIGNVTDEGVEKTARIPMTSIASVLAGTGAFVFGNMVYVTTHAQLTAITPSTETAGGVVLNDTDPTKNGYYSRVAAAWVRQRGFPDTFAQVTLGGTANAQTGTVAAGVNPADVLVFFATVGTDNTGPMTLSHEDEAARDVVNAAGNALTAGEWTGTVLYFLNSDGDYQLLFDAGAAAAAAQSATDAQTAQAAAELARDQAQAAASTASAGGFASIAAAEAYAPLSAPDFMRLEGYATAGDGGGALYKKVASEPSHAGKFSITLDDGVTVVWYELADGQVISDRMFGVVADDTADDTAAMQNLAAYLKDKGGGKLVMSGGTRKVWTTAPTHLSALMDVRGCKGLIVEYHDGASIHAVTPNSTTDGGTRFAQIWDITGVEGFICVNPKVTQDGAKVPDGYDAGIIHFAANLNTKATARGIKITGASQVGGIGGLIIYPPNTNAEADISRDIVYEGVHTNVYYPANFQANGDDHRIDIKSIGCGRSYFPYNVSGGRARIDSDNNSGFDDVLLTAYTSPTFRNQLTDIEVWYRQRGHDPLINSNMVAINFVQSDGTSRSATIEGVKVHFDVRAGTYLGCAFSVNKYDSAGAADNTPRGHSLVSTTIDGRIDGSFTGSNPVQICSASDWTGDFITKFVIDRLMATFNVGGSGTVFAIDGRGMPAGQLTVRDSFVDCAVTLSNLAGKSSIIGSNLTGYSDGSSGSWYMTHQPVGRLKLVRAGVSIASGAGTTLTLPATDALAANPIVVATPKSAAPVFQCVPISANSFTIVHNAGSAVTFDIMVEMAY